MERDIEVLEAGLDTLIGPRGVKLSGGQQQRAAAARMFVRDPELLVFDDLSSALDVDTERPCGNGSSHAGSRRAWSCPIGGRCCGGRATSSCCTRAGWSRRESSMSCWRPAKR